MHYVEKVLLSSSIWDELFAKALRIGYDKEQSDIVHEVISGRYMHPSYRHIKVETPENDYCETALAQILQQRINNSEVFEENISFLDQMLARYDPLISDEHLKPVPDDFSIPEFESKTWIKNINCELPENLNSFDWVTLYSSAKFCLSNFGEEGTETEKIATLLIPAKDAMRHQNDFGRSEIDDIMRCVPLCKTIKEFKNIPSLLNYDMLGIPLIVSYNDWRLHHPNILVRLDQSFLEQNSLKWDEESVLSLTLNGSTVVQYEHWAGPFNGERYSRDRIASGVRLRIKREFLKCYLKSKNMSMFMMIEKKRRIVKPDAQSTDNENPVTLKKWILYSDTLMASG